MFSNLEKEDFLKVRDDLKKGIELLNSDYGFQLVLITNYNESEGVPMIAVLQDNEDVEGLEEAEEAWLCGPDDNVKVSEDYDYNFQNTDDMYIKAIDFLLCCQELTHKVNDLMYYCFLNRCTVESVMNDWIREDDEGNE